MFYYGFPVVLLTTCDADGKTNISPISSSWCLDGNFVIGIGTQGKAFENITVCPEAVLNLPDARLWPQVEAIAPFTGKHPPSADKQALYRHTDDKFALGAFTAQPSLAVKPARIAECPLQAEARVEHIHRREAYAVVELSMLHVHAHEDLLSADNKINPEAWQPLIYSFRHYHGLTETLGRNFRAGSG